MVKIRKMFDLAMFESLFELKFNNNCVTFKKCEEES